MQGYRLGYPCQMLQVFLACVDVEYVPLAILMVVEVYVPADERVRITVLVIAESVSTPIPIGHILADMIDKGDGNNTCDDRSARGEQSPYTLGKLAVSLVPEPSQAPSQCLARSSPHDREVHSYRNLFHFSLDFDVIQCSYNIKELSQYPFLSLDG